MIVIFTFITFVFIRVFSYTALDYPVSYLGSLVCAVIIGTLVWVPLFIGEDDGGLTEKDPQDFFWKRTYAYLAVIAFCAIILPYVAAAFSDKFEYAINSMDEFIWVAIMFAIPPISHLLIIFGPEINRRIK